MGDLVVWAVDENAAQKEVSRFRFVVSEPLAVAWTGAERTPPWLTLVAGRYFAPGSRPPYPLIVRGGSEPLHFACQNLPAGLALDSETGNITGTPLVSGSVLVVMTVTDAAGAFQQLPALQLEVVDVLRLAAHLRAQATAPVPPEPLVVARATAGWPMRWEPATTGGKTPLSAWLDVEGGAARLPSGLAVDNSTGAISGAVQTTLAGPTSIVFHLLVEDAIGQTDRSRRLALALWPALRRAAGGATERETQSLVVGRSFIAATPAVVGGRPPYQFRVRGALLTGVEINAVSGRLSGQPTVLGERSEFAVVAEDANGAALDTLVVDATVTPPPDCDSLALGRTPCGDERLCVDSVPFDGQYMCNCSGAVVAEAVCATRASSSESDSGAARAAVLGPVIGGCLLFALLVVLLVVAIRRRRSRQKPFDFQQEFERLVQEGLIRLDGPSSGDTDMSGTVGEADEEDEEWEEEEGEEGAGEEGVDSGSSRRRKRRKRKQTGRSSMGGRDCIPREIARSKVRLVRLIGSGAAGQVWEGFVDEFKDTGVPEYQVAVKMLNDKAAGNAVEKEIMLRDLMREATYLAQFEHRK